MKLPDIVSASLYLGLATARTTTVTFHGTTYTLTAPTTFHWASTSRWTETFISTWGPTATTEPGLPSPTSIESSLVPVPSSTSTSVLVPTSETPPPAPTTTSETTTVAPPATTTTSHGRTITVTFHSSVYTLTGPTTLHWQSTSLWTKTFVSTWGPKSSSVSTSSAETSVKWVRPVFSYVMPSISTETSTLTEPCTKCKETSKSVPPPSSLTTSTTTVTEPCVDCKSSVTMSSTTSSSSAPHANTSSNPLTSSAVTPSPQVPSANVTSEFSTSAKTVCDSCVVTATTTKTETVCSDNLFTTMIQVVTPLAPTLSISVPAMKPTDTLVFPLVPSGPVVHPTDTPVIPKIPEEPKPEEPKPEEPKPEEPKPVEPKPVEPKPVEPKSEGPKPEESQPEEPQQSSPTEFPPDFISEEPSAPLLSNGAANTYVSAFACLAAVLLL